ncbi:MAG: hypothetical protein FWC72_07565 [Oscillospiraceae bacterium]|nr:hypothetical protein [Oscillospiraceae bacterium]
MHYSPVRKKGNGILRFGAMILALSLLLAACGGGAGGGGGGGGRGAPEVLLDNTFFETYAYLPTSISLPELPDQVQGSAVRGDRIYFWYVERAESPNFETEEEWEEFDWEAWQSQPVHIVVASVSADGGGLQEFRIEAPSQNARVSGAHVTAAGNLAMVIENHTWTERGSSTVVLYVEYDTQGRQISSRELDIVPADVDWFQLENISFLENGSMVLSVWGNQGMDILFLNSAGDVTESVSLDSFRGGGGAAVQLADGRVVMQDWEIEGEGERARQFPVLRVIDMETGEWGETYPFNIPSARALFPAGDGFPFDLLADDGTHLFGYNLETGERSVILSWVESGLVAGWGTHVGFLDDGRITALTSEWANRSRRGGEMAFDTELLVFTRTSRSELPERVTLTLGGMWFSDEVRRQVVAFNRESLTHQIQLRDYGLYATGGDWMGATRHFAADVATGQGPDILIYESGGISMNRRMLADLYPFLDADPVLSRGDFFQNILGALEGADGRLTMIANAFSLNTMVGMEAVVGHLDSWTFTDMLTLIEEANVPHVMGEWLTRENFLFQALHFGGRDLFDWDAGTANLDSEAFINLLEVAARLPADRPADGGGFVAMEGDSEMGRMLRGEQLLYMTWLSNPQRYVELRAMFGEMAVLGMPTNEGGAHTIFPQSGLAISAGSAHQDAAWEFVRRFLMPDAEVEWSFPLRIDLFEAQIQEEMTPDEWQEEGQPRFTMWMGEGLEVSIYPMTQEEARSLRALIEGPVMVGRMDETVREMVEEGLLPFFAGDSTAEATARVLQNRVQTYLNERR